MERTKRNTTLNLQIIRQQFLDAKDLQQQLRVAFDYFDAWNTERWLVQDDNKPDARTPLHHRLLELIKYWTVPNVWGVGVENYPELVQLGVEACIYLIDHPKTKEIEDIPMFPQIEKITDDILEKVKYTDAYIALKYDPFN